MSVFSHALCLLAHCWLNCTPSPVPGSFTRSSMIPWRPLLPMWAGMVVGTLHQSVTSVVACKADTVEHIYAKRSRRCLAWVRLLLH